jgi:hypothetical protein
MARTTDYSKKIEKIKSQLDELGAVINSIQGNPGDTENPSPIINIKALDIDLEKESTKDLMKLQTRIVRIINQRLKAQQ